VEPFEVPAHWARFRSMDWGSAKPFSVGWWAIVSDDHHVPRAEGGPDRLLPRGALVRYREWYGAASQCGVQDDRRGGGRGDHPERVARSQFAVRGARSRVLQGGWRTFDRTSSFLRLVCDHSTPQTTRASHSVGRWGLFPQKLMARPSGLGFPELTVQHYVFGRVELFSVRRFSVLRTERPPRLRCPLTVKFSTGRHVVIASS
jgi:hypothetical protein